MNCQELLDQLSDYLDKEMRDDLCREIETHLERCHDCRVEVDKTRKTIVLYQADQPVELNGLMAASTRLQSALAKAYADPPGRPSD